MTALQREAVRLRLTEARGILDEVIGAIADDDVVAGERDLAVVEAYRERKRSEREPGGKR